MDAPIERLQPFVGEWTMRAELPGAPAAEGHVECEWMAGRQFLIQQWGSPAPEAPDCLALIGFDKTRGTFLQHYFDSRGVSRLYQMTLENGVWKLWRDAPDFSPLDFAQRFTGKFSADGTTIVGHWERARDGEAWEHDFDLTYSRVR